MIRDLIEGRLPDIDCTGFNPVAPNWTNLEKLWTGPIHFGVCDHPEFGISWEIQEVLPNGGFHMTRSQLTKQRNTIQDTYGLLGLSLINLKDSRVILTEGVSDFFTVKMYCPNNNVLGVTTLSGSHDAKQILISFFDEFIICADNDSTAQRNTGLLNAQNFKRFLESFNKKVKIVTPQYPHKDMTDNFIFNLRTRNLNSTVF